MDGAWLLRRIGAILPITPTEFTEPGPQGSGVLRREEIEPPQIEMRIAAVRMVELFTTGPAMLLRHSDYRGGRVNLEAGLKFRAEVLWTTE